MEEFYRHWDAKLGKWVQNDNVIWDAGGFWRYREASDPPKLVSDKRSTRPMTDDR
jgi:hypothetical protein